MTRAMIEVCEATARMTGEALGWLADGGNEARVGSDRPGLERVLRNHAYQARRLARSVDRPMCVGVFGPSQAGKSYLVSVLARKGDALMAVFDDRARPEINFITDINPYGDKEATGLVTRFSKTRATTPPGFPVALRLLSQTDVVKILANSYFLDGDQQIEPAPPREAIEQHVAGFEARQRADYTDTLREEDIWDVEDYVTKQLRQADRTAVIKPFWTRMAACAPRLALQDRAQLLSVLWGRHPQLTALFLTLLEALSALAFAEDAFCKVDALVPAVTGILNVETLEGLGQANAQTIEVATASGRSVALPRPVVTALAAELRISLKEIPWPFLDHTDLLDFPGYRSRTQHDLTRYLKEAGGKALKELYLRGKVDYLFQRYTIDQELTGMLLCIPPSNLEVATLPAVIEDWIGTTHGRTAEDRRNRSTLLFFLLTKFDQHFAEKAGDQQDDASLATTKLRFEARMQASLIKPFAKLPGSWPLKWTPEAPFKNCYWIRNPQYKAEAVIEYEGGRELRVVPGKTARIAQLKQACVQVDEVRAHFHDPERAFDEVMRLNDGGISYLAEELAKVCRAGIKLEQVRGRLQELRGSIRAAIEPFYVSTDAEQRVAERTLVAEQIIHDFETCVEMNRFGTFLQGLNLGGAALADALYEARNKRSADQGASDDKSESKPVPEVRQKGGLLASVLGQHSQAASQAPPPSRQPARTTLSSSRSDLFIRTAMQVWTENLRVAGEDQEFSDAVAVPLRSLREIATELSATARRLRLEDHLRQRLSGVSHTVEGIEQASAKATIVCERLINRFVSDLDLEAPRPQPVFDAKDILSNNGEGPGDLVINWLRKLREHILANARSGDGLIDNPEQNARLGQVIGELRKPLPDTAV
jgi:hypothetical protein